MKIKLTLLAVSFITLFLMSFTCSIRECKSFPFLKNSNASKFLADTLVGKNLIDLAKEGKILIFDYDKEAILAKANIANTDKDLIRQGGICTVLINESDLPGVCRLILVYYGCTTYQVYQVITLIP